MEFLLGDRAERVDARSSRRSRSVRGYVRRPVQRAERRQARHALLPGAAGQRPRHAVRDPRRRPGVAVDPPPGRGHEQHAGPRRQLAVPVPDEVPEPVADERAFACARRPAACARGRRRRCRLPRATSALARLFWRLDGQVSSSTPQCRKTTTVSEVARARSTSWTSRETSFADARPGFRGPAVHAEMRWSSSTCVAPMIAMRWPSDLVRYGAVRARRVEPRADDREAVPLGGGERVAQAALAVVHAVVVRERRDVDAAAAERRVRARRSAEDVLLRHRARRRSSPRSRGSRPRGRRGRAAARSGRARSPARRRASPSSTPSKWTSPPNANDDRLPASERPRACAGEASPAPPPEPREQCETRGEQRGDEAERGGEERVTRRRGGASGIGAR